MFCVLWHIDGTFQDITEVAAEAAEEAAAEVGQNTLPAEHGDGQTAFCCWWTVAVPMFYVCGIFHSLRDTPPAHNFVKISIYL